MYEIMSECNEWVLRNEMRNYNVMNGCFRYMYLMGNKKTSASSINHHAYKHGSLLLLLLMIIVAIIFYIYDVF